MADAFLEEIFQMKGFGDINKGLIGPARLAEWVKDYFNVEEDMSNFERRNEGYLELRSRDKSRGYVFAGEIQLDRDYERRMRDVKERDYFNKIIVREFVDYDNRIAGFSWRIEENKDG